MNVREIFEWNYAEYITNTCGTTKYEWAASYIFDLVTYDGGLDELFVKKIIEVCKVILDKTSYEYIKDENNYINYILVCQILDKFSWIDWGTSIRGAWFGPSYNPRYILEGTEITYYGNGKPETKGHPDVPFTIENLKKLIKFIETEE